MEGYAKTQSSGFAVQAAVKVTWSSLKDKCPGNGCGSLEREPTGAAAGGAQGLERLEPIVKVIDPGNPGRGAARTKLIFPSDPEYAEAKAEEQALERERGSVGLAGGYTGASSAAETFNEETTKASMTSIGAAPADDATRWAEQTEDENMPVRYSLRSVCEMIQLGLYRLYGQQYTSHELGVVDPEAVSYGKTSALNPDDPIDESPGALQTQAYMEQFKFDLRAVQADPLTAKQMDNVVDFCTALQARAGRAPRRRRDARTHRTHRTHCAHHSHRVRPRPRPRPPLPPSRPRPAQRTPPRRLGRTTPTTATT